MVSARLWSHSMQAPPVVQTFVIVPLRLYLRPRYVKRRARIADED